MLKFFVPDVKSVLPTVVLQIAMRFSPQLLGQSLQFEMIEFSPQLPT